MNLDELLGSLEKAAEESKKPADDADKPQVSKELDALLTKEAAADNVKKAFEDGEKLAHSILEKLATEAVTQTTEAEKTTEVKADAKTEEVEKKAEEKSETKDEDMNKQANDAGKELATAILEKLAANQAPMVQNTGTPGGHKVHDDTAKSVAQDDAKIGPTPGRNGTINQVFDAIVSKARAISNPAHEDQTIGGGFAGHEAKDQAMGTPSVPPSPDITEKQAAVDALCQAGLDWETAVELVKSAAEEIEAEEMSQVKIAAVNELLEDGMDFDTAVTSVNMALETPAEESLSQIKIAAVNELLNDGVEFDEAVDSVNQAVTELSKEAGKAGELFSKSKDAVKAFAGRAGSKGREMAGKAKSKGSELAAKAKTHAAAAGGKVKELSKSRAVQAGAGGLAVGGAAGYAAGRNSD